MREKRGSGVTERSGMNDDDKAPTLPEVTVPPWLRTGPVADPSVSTPQPMTGSAVGARGAEAERAGMEELESPPAAPPTRITLGAQNREVPTGGAGALGGTAPEGTAGEHGVGPTRERDAGRPVDDLSRLPLRSAARASGAAAGSTSGPAGAQKADPVGGRRPAVAGAQSSTHDGARSSEGAADEVAPTTPFLARRPVRIAMSVAAGAAVLGGSGVLGFVVVRGASGPGAGAVVAGATPGCEALTAEGRVTGSGPGSLGSPAGAVLAFDHAYYVDRSAEKAFAAVAPSSRMTEEQLRVDGIDRLAEDTTHCVQVSELAPTLLEVELTEFPPESDPVVIRQRIRVTENADGTWGIVSITPAG